jgi:polysaccharide biosynthesis transport protein
MDTDSTNKPRFADYVRPLWSRKWLILIAVAVATGGVYAYYARQANVYTSKTLAYVRDPGDPVSGLPSLQSTDRSVQNQASLLYSLDVAERVARKIEFDGSPGGLLDRVSIAGREGEDFVEITAEGRSPQEAADIANAYTRQFVALVNNAQRNRIERALELSRNQLEAVPQGPATQGTRQTLGDQIRRLELALEVPPDTTRQVDPAVAPSSPTSPKPLRNALFAFVLSLLIAVGVAFGLERFDRRLKRPEDVDGVYGQTLLATLPHTKDTAPIRDGAAALGHEFREAFRVLRMNIELARLDAPLRTIVVSSAVPGEGKSTVVRNLALAFVETGKRVAVVEGDLRHPGLASLLGAHGGPGLTDVLTSDLELSEVTVDVEVAVPRLDGVVRSNGTAGGNGSVALAAQAGSMTLLLSGPRPANPPAVLASDRVTEVLDELREHHDVVLIDSAPLLAVSDTVPLLRYADASIFVCRLGFTTRDTAKRLVSFLDRIPDAAPLGIVANDLSSFDAHGYGYGYSYGYGEEAKGAKTKQAV